MTLTLLMKTAMKKILRRVNKIFFIEAYGKEHGIDGDGEYCGVNDAQLSSINVFCHAASDGQDVPRAVLFDLGPGVIGAATLTRRSAGSSARATS
jgi:hypothetical protein